MALAFFRGINFPFTKSAQALPAPVTDSDLIKQSLEQIIMTGKNERVMRPDFGSGVLRFVFENNDELLNELIRAEVMSAVGRFEPRVAIQDIEIDKDVEKSEVTITLVYVLVTTRQQDTVEIVVPTR
jgi:phage baseplate assembly protein W